MWIQRLIAAAIVFAIAVVAGHSSRPAAAAVEPELSPAMVLHEECATEPATRDALLRAEPEPAAEKPARMWM